MILAMKKAIIFFCIISLIVPSFSFAAVSVKGYTRKDGTYVAPHYRSNPDGNPYNNYSFPGNTNPYTGKVAPGNPDTYLKNYYDNSTYSSSYVSPYSTYTNIKPVITPTLPVANVSYVTKLWVDTNPGVNCSQSTFLRNKQKLECETYRTYKNNYMWNTTMNDLDNKYYTYDTGASTARSCSDGYRFSFDTDPPKCIPEAVSNIASVICPLGYTCTPVR